MIILRLFYQRFSSFSLESSSRVTFLLMPQNDRSLTAKSGRLKICIEHAACRQKPSNTEETVARRDQK